MSRWKELVNSVQYMYKLGVSKAKTSLNYKRQYRLGDCSLDETIGLHYVDIVSVYDRIRLGYSGFGKYDENGIPMYNYGSNIGYQYSAHLCSIYAMALHGKFITTKDEVYRDEFFRIVDWLVKYAKKEDDGGVVWHINFDFPVYRMKKPWIGALGQGRAISVFVRAYQESKKEEFLDYAQRAMVPFRKTIAEGGVQSKDRFGNFWLEEYPTVPPSHVLNGFIFTLFGILDLYRITRSNEAMRMFQDGVSTLEKSLSYYDTGFWTVYDQYWRNIVSKHYHIDIHTLQVKALYEITRESIFKQYAERWERYITNLLSNILWLPSYYACGIYRISKVKLLYRYRSN